jgi:hypothetical protein
MKIQLFVILSKSDHDPDVDPHWFGSLVKTWIRIDWSRIRIRIETNAESQH